MQSVKPGITSKAVLFHLILIFHGALSGRGVQCAPGLTQTKLGENLLKLAQID